MSKHTPGPWLIGESSPYEEGLDEIAVMGSPMEHGIPCVALSVKLPFEGMQIANTHLISAAPDLLQALWNAEKKLASYVGVCGGDKELVDETLPMVRAAIAKATGEKPDQSASEDETNDTKDLAQAGSETRSGCCPDSRHVADGMENTKLTLGDCQHCGTSFLTINDKFCSPECKQSFWQNAI